MADGTQHHDDRPEKPADEAALSARLKRLDERLGRTRPGELPDSGAPASSTMDSSAFARGFRLSTELIGGVIVGGGLGWLADSWLGTKPWAFIVLLMLGFVGGVLNVMRSAGLAPPAGQAGQEQQEKTDRD
jgi:ATP synthase protein I